MRVTNAKGRKSNNLLLKNYTYIFAIRKKSLKEEGIIQ
jgi:hypothetical protein